MPLSMVLQGGRRDGDGIFATIDQTDIRGLDTAAQWVRRQLASLSWLGSVGEPTSDSLVRGFCVSRKPSPSLLPPAMRKTLSSGHLVGHHTPEETGQLTSNGHDSHLGASAPQYHAHILAVQPPSRAVDIAQHGSLHTLAPFRQIAAAGVIVSIVPGSLHQ